MRRGRILILFALIVLFGVAAVYLVMRRGGGGGGAAPEETPLAPQDTTMVVFSNQDIARGSVIPEDGVGLQPYPRDMVVETMIENDVSRVVGHHARQDIPRGVPVTTGMITDRAGDMVGTGSAAAFSIPPGYTAISLPLSRLSGVAYAMRDGDQVDVIMSMLMVDLDPEFQTLLPNQALSIVSPDFGLLTALICTEFRITSQGTECINPAPPIVGRPVIEEETDQFVFNIPTEPQRPRLVTQRIVQNATVLHVGMFATEAEEEAPPVVQAVPEAGTEGAAAVQPTPVAPLAPDIVTLIVTPQDALTLYWAMGSGATLSFTLRSPDDATVTDTVSVTLQYLMQTYSVTLPVRLPYGSANALESVVVPVLPNDAPAEP